MHQSIIQGQRNTFSYSDKTFSIRLERFRKKVKNTNTESSKLLMSINEHYTDELNLIFLGEVGGGVDLLLHICPEQGLKPLKVRVYNTYTI